MDRLVHLEKTYAKSINNASSYSDKEFILLNYGSKKDDIDNWVKNNLIEFINSNLVKYYKTTEPEYWEEDQKTNQDNDDSEPPAIMTEMDRPTKVIATPMGIIPMNEYTCSSKIFNFWTGHANFDLTEEVADIIETSPGVESLNIFTRYRFRIGIGKAFKDAEIMKLIQDKTYEHLDEHQE